MAVMAVMALCIAIAVLTGCGGGSENGSGDGDSQEPARLGCGEFCQQAGGIGDAFSGMEMLTIDVGASVQALPDGAVPVAVTCQFIARCEGAVLLNSDLSVYPPQEGSRSDLLVEAGSSRTIAVPLTEIERRRLERAGRLEIAITALLTPAWEPLPTRERKEWRPVVSAVTLLTAPEP
jgi:hypothetical protein